MAAEPRLRDVKTSESLVTIIPGSDDDELPSVDLWRYYSRDYRCTWFVATSGRQRYQFPLGTRLADINFRHIQSSFAEI